jgi:hypothetical protein
MTIEEAAAILNREKHRDFDKWFVGEWQKGKPCLWGQEDCCTFWLEEFEAVAIAREYERRAKPDTGTHTP